MILEQATSKAAKKVHPSILVMWGDKFQEWIATNVVIQLRRKGIRVKIIGLQGRTARGVNGLTIEADLPLGQAQDVMGGLIGDVTHIVFPCNTDELKRLEYDPRLREFLASVAKQGVQLVLGDDCAKYYSLELLRDFGDNIAFCPNDDEINHFVESLAASLPYAN